MELRKLIRQLSRDFPFSLSEEWDFPGYQCGRKDAHMDIHKVMLCLDFEESGFQKALEFQPDLILTHHPFLFGKRDEVLKADPLKADLIIRIEEELHCPIYSYHTCFDKGEGGINDQILKRLGFSKERNCPDGLVRIASLDKAYTIEELAAFIKKELKLPYAFYLKGAIDSIYRIGLCAGGGSSLYQEAIDCGADCFISGDCPHHTRLDMKRYQINYIDISHEVEEDAFLVGMETALTKADSGFDILPYRFEKDFNEVAYDK